ncbi:MAG: AI-2E family transporter [Deltaproteobacteria bacterium]|jgi:AI-2 transport protein TqsA|nr:AI-2E family transporter [Deltaproteobacteria bacterium]
MEKSIKRGGESVVLWAAWALLVVLVVVILKTLAFLFVPLAIALLLVYALGIPLNFLARFNVPNFLRILLVVFLGLLFLYLFGRLIAVNINDLQEQFPVYEEKFWSYGQYLLASAGMSVDEAKEMYHSFLTTFTHADIKPLGAMVQRMGGSFFSFLGDTIWVLLFLIFLLAEREGFQGRLRRSLGRKQSAPVLEALGQINKSMQHYLGLKTAISGLTGFLVGITLVLFGIDFALLWGTLAFVLNFIPNIGSLIAVIPPVAITLFQTGSLSTTLVVAAMLVSIQMVMGNVVEPKVMGEGLSLSPLLVLLSLLFWGWMWGIPGMLLSVPLTAAIKIGMEQLDITRPVARFMADKESEPGNIFMLSCLIIFSKLCGCQYQ